MKILYLSSFCNPKNGSSFIFTLYNYFSPNCVIVTTDPYQDKETGHSGRGIIERIVDKLIRITIDRIWPNLYRANHFKLLRSINRENPDVIHIHWIHGHVIPLSLIRSLGKKYKIFWTFHDMFPLTGDSTYEDENSGWRDGYKNLPIFNRTRRSWQMKYNVLHGIPITIITLSEWMKDKILESPIFKNHKIVRLNHSVDVDVFKPITSEDKMKLRERFEIPNTNIILAFISVSLNNKRKGYNHFLEALELVDKKISSKISAVIVGKEDRPVKPLPVHTVKVGFGIDEILLRDIYNIAYAYILPSEVESLSVTAMESTSCGTPVIGFNVGGIPTVIKNGMNGYLVSSAQEIAQKIEMLVSNPELREQLSQKSRQNALENFSYKQISKLESLYHESNL